MENLREVLFIGWTGIYKPCFSGPFTPCTVGREMPGANKKVSTLGLLNHCAQNLQLFMCCAQLLSCVQLFVTPLTVAHQAPLSMGILQARILERVAMPSSGDLPNPGIEPWSSILQTDPLPTEPPGKPANASCQETSQSAGECGRG